MARQAGSAGTSSGGFWAADSMNARFSPLPPSPSSQVHGAARRAAHDGATTLRESGNRNRDAQGRAVEQRLDEEGAADLLDAGDADGEDEDAADRAPDIDPPRLDCGRAE